MGEYLRPQSLDEALRLRRAHPELLVLAGGTDLMVGASLQPEPSGFLDLFHLPELQGVLLADDAIEIAAATPYATLLRHARLAAELPMLHACMSQIGGAQIQARGTIGGNLATASPAGDTLPVLLALDASVSLRSAGAARTLRCRDFITGHRTTALGPDEIIASIAIPRPEPSALQYFRKVGARAAQAISKVVVAACGACDDAGAIAAVRIACGAVADRPVRLPEVERLLLGARPSGDTARAAGRVAEAAIDPIDDLRSTAAYRRRTTGNLIASFVAELGASPAPRG